MKDTIVIGLCGRSGSGKGYVSSLFTSFGGCHIDTDEVYHDLLLPKDGKMSECTKELSAAFGGGITDGAALNRRALGNIVFSDPEKLKLLNIITHKYIKAETLAAVEKCSNSFAVIDAPLLFESGFDALCDFTVCVTANEETLIKRICKRDGISEDEAKIRLRTQIGSDELASRCDFVIDNSYGHDATDDVKNILSKKGLL